MNPILWTKDKWNKIIAWWYNNWDIDGANFNIWEWTNVCFILIDNNHYTVYKDWELQYSNVYTEGLINNDFITIWTRGNNATTRWDKWDWWISEIIVENKEWTQQEILNYFNKTKSKYWY